MATILPVLDVRDGEAVQAIGGRRSEYQPVKSVLTASSDALAVALALRRQAGTNELYVADLDALMGGQPQWPLWEVMAKAGVRLWLDAATHEAEQARWLLDLGVENLVIASESLPSPQALTELAETPEPDSLVFSLDLLNGQLLGGPAAWRKFGPGAIAMAAWNCGLRRFIVLDLAAVGGGQGPATLDQVRKLQRLMPEAELISGGGVRGADDVEAFAAAGADRVLVGTALHRGVPF